jgi:hypothetical protein
MKSLPLTVGESCSALFGQFTIKENPSRQNRDGFSFIIYAGKRLIYQLDLV